MDVDLSIPEGLPDDIVAKLRGLQQELEDGDITAKGYRKHRDLILAAAEETAHDIVSTVSGSIHEESHRSSTSHAQDSLVDSASQYEMPISYQDSDTWSQIEPQRSIQDQSSMSYRATSVTAQKVLADDSWKLRNVKLQRPLDPREIPDNIGSDPHNGSIQMSKFDNLPSILRHRGKAISRQNAIVIMDNKGKEDLTIAWDKLSSRAEKVAQMIRDKSGLYRGDRVTLIYQQSEIIEFAVALLGCFLAGVVAVPVSPTAPFKDIAYILSSTQSHLALTTDSNFRNLQRIMATQKLQSPRGVEWWKTNEFGSYHPPNKKAELPALQVPDLAYIEFARSPLGELRGVVMSHRTILHQMTCLTAMLQSRTAYKYTSVGRGPPRIGAETVLCNLDVRQSIGLIIGILLTVYSGNTLVWIPQQPISVEGLYANIISRYRVNVLLSDYPTLKQVAYSYQQSPLRTRNYSKKQAVDFSTLQWCLIDALTVDSEFHEVLADRWLKPLGNKNAREIVAPLLTLSEHGGMVISMRDWLQGQEKMGCRLLTEEEKDVVQDDEDEDTTGPFVLSEVSLDMAALTTNNIRIISTSGHTVSSDESKKSIRVGAFGYPLPDATLAIVNPDTRMLCPEMDVGEIWIDSPSLSGGFWGLVRETDAVFHAQCFDSSGPIDLEFLRTGLLGFIYDGKVYVLGLYEDRLRQKVDRVLTDTSTNASSAELSTTPLQVIGSEYQYHYTAHLVNTIMRGVPQVFDCSAFDVFVNGEHLPVVVLETSLAAVNTSAQGGGGGGGGSSSNLGNNSDRTKRQMNDLAQNAIVVLDQQHQVRVYCVLVTPSNSLPRIVRSGRPEIGNMLCKRRFDLGLLPAEFVKFGVEKALRNVPIGQDPYGGIWSSAISQFRDESLMYSDKQYSGVDFRDMVIDDRTAAPLSDFESIVDILKWRVSHQNEELAYSTIDGRAREGKGLSWKKFDQKIATVASALKQKYRMRAGDVVILMYTHSEDFVVAVYACLLLGICGIPLSPIDSGRLGEDVPAFINLIKDFGVRGILVNSDTEGTLKIKTVAQNIKQTAVLSKVTVFPPTINTTKPKVTAVSCKDFKIDKNWLNPDFAALVWAYWTPDHKSQTVQLSHKSIMGMCKIQKETCQMTSTKPIVGCVRSVSGLGFLHTCFMGVYLGSSTLLVSPIDYATNPVTFFLTLSRYKVKDTYSTPQMMDHACSILKPKGFSLSDTKNLMVTSEGRPRTDLVKKIRILFSTTGLESTSINLGYSHILNPLITTRSYMSLEPIDLWLDPIALRQGYVNIVNPENYANALHLHDSGMVPISTQVAIVNPETCKLCKVGEYGEIWVYSEGNVANFFTKNRDQFTYDRFHGRIADSNAPNVEYVRTGDLGFLHTVSRQLVDSNGSGGNGIANASGGGGGGGLEMQTLFLLGRIGETFEVCGLNHFPIDIETSVEKCHKAITSGGSAIFQAGGMIILVVEINQSTAQFQFAESNNNGHHQTVSLASLVPVIVNTVLDEHQFVVDIVAFVGKGDFPRSRLGEKQRGKILVSWVTKRLPKLAHFGVCQGEKKTFEILRQRDEE